MSLQNELLDLEKRFWTGDAEFYRRHVADECLVAFTQMAGVMGKDAIASTVKDGQRWRDLNIDEDGFLPLGDTAAIVTYHAKATRATGEPYEAVVSSGYVKHGGEWKLAFHQQTPTG
jgi:ketosteroid isomerase-like protein